MSKHAAGAPAPTVDWSAVLAELEGRKREVDQAIESVRRIAGPHVALGVSPATTVTSGTSNGSAGKRGKRRASAIAPRPGKRKPGTWATPETWAQARTLFEGGTKAEQIATQLGVTKAAIYYHAVHDKPRWKRPKEAKATGEQLPGKVRCPSCELWTERDPCSNCGKKVRR